jgi:hypothetical protein
MRRWNCGVSAACLLALGGCGEVGTRPVAVPLDQVPPPVMDVARQNAPPGVKLDSARKFTLHGEDVYEVRGKDQRGKIREVEISASGKLLEIE